MARGALPPHTISAYDPDLHDLSAFDCGHAAINAHVRHHLAAAIAHDRSAAQVLCADGDRPAPAMGLYAMNAHSVRQAASGRLGQGMTVDEIPAIYLSLVAVARAWQGRRLGTALMVHAIRRAIDIADQIGASALILDVAISGIEADDARRRDFYLRLGFQPMHDGANPGRMYLTMQDARATL